MLSAKEKVVTLAECIKIALQNNPARFISEEDSKISKAQYKIAQADRGIKVDGQIKTIERLKEDSDSNFRIPGIDTNIGLFGGLYVRYKLVDLAKAKAEKAAKLNVSISKVKSTATVHSIKFNVKNLYYELLLATDKLVLKKELMANFEKKLKLTKKLFQSGRRPILDLSKARVALEKARLDHEKAINEVRAKSMELKIVMGAHNDDGLIIIPQSISTVPVLKHKVGDLQILAGHYNPGMIESRIKRKQKRIEIEIAQKANLPRIDLLLALGFETRQLYLFNSGEGDFRDNFKFNNWEPIFTGQITMALPLYYGGALHAQEDIVASEYKKMDFKARDELKKLKVKVRNLYYDLNALKKQMDMTTRIIKNSEKHVLLALRSYENGIGSIFSLQDAEAGVLTSEVNFLILKYSYLRKIASLANLVGLNEEKICQK